MKKLLLIDGNSLLFRAFFGQGGGARLTSTQGVPTGALHTFMMMYLKYMKELNPTHVCVAFDTAEPTFRHKRFDAYKGKRPDLPEDLALQMPILRELLDAMSISRVELAGYEADDLIGSYARLAEESGMRVEILTGDKDSFQCISEKTHVIMPPFKASMGSYSHYDIAAFQERYGVLPEQFVDVKALMGDSSDNIPGVPGVGEKTALKLIVEYGSLDALYEHTDALKGKLKERVVENKEQAYLSQELSRIDCFVPLSETWRDLSRFKIRQPENEAELRALLSELNMNRILSRMNLKAVATQEESSIEVLERVELTFTDFLSKLIEFKGYGKNKQAFFSFSEAAKPYKSLKAALPLLTQGAYLGFSIGEKNYISPCPAEEKDRLALSEALYQTAFELITYRSKETWREGIFHPNQSVCDLETVVYLAADKGEIKDFSNLIARCLGIHSGQMPESTQDWAIFQLDYLPALYKNLQAYISENPLKTLAEQVDFPLSSCLGRMEKRGFRVSPEVLDELHERFASNTKTLEESIYLSAGHPFNINSPMQLSTVLYEELGLPAGKKRQNSYATDMTELQRLNSLHPIVGLIMAYRLQAKLDSTFVVGLKKYISKEDGRIHSYFNQNYTSTGRLSSKDPNLQNIPVKNAMGKEIRRAFIAKPGYRLLDADYSQIELRLLAHLADEPNMIEAFCQDKDIHRRTAAHLFSIPEDEVKVKQRATAKTVNFSIIYGISAYSLSQDLETSVGEAKRYIDEYNEQYPGVKKYMKEQIQAAKDHGFVQTLFGRRRYIEELKSQNFNVRQFGERAAMNTPVQGTAADIIRMAMLRAEEIFERAGIDAGLVSQVHDELIFEVREDQAEKAADLLHEAMEKVVQLKVPLKAEVAIGSNWFDAKS